MNRSSLVPWLPLHALLTLAWGACNPLSLAAALWLAPHHETSTNVEAWSPVPFVLVGALVSALSQLLLGALLTWVNGGKLTAARVAAGLQVAQLPFLPMVFVAKLAFDGLEGNIIGFFVLPGSVIYLALATPASLVILATWVLVARRRAAAAASSS